MKGVKELKARLKSVGNIKKVTSTMELVATAKMKKLQERALASRPYAESIRAMMGQVAAFVSDDVSPLLEVPDKIERECFIVVAGDKGLCGGFNTNVFRKAIGIIKERQAAGSEISVYCIGRRTETFFRKIGGDIVGAIEEKVESIGYRRVSETMRALSNDFVEGRFNRVTVVYTMLASPVKFVPKAEELLPLAQPEAAEGDEAKTGVELDYVMEPSPEVIMKRLIPKSLDMSLLNAIQESLASEFASRRIAMKNATDSASDMIDELRMEYNKARQSGITGELLEITAGAEALNG